MQYLRFQVDLRRTEGAVTHQILDLISRTARVGDVTPESMPQLMRGDRPVQAGPADRSRDDVVDRGGRDRSPGRLAEQVDQHELSRTRRYPDF